MTESLAIRLAAVAAFAAVMALPAGEALAKDGAEGGHSFIFRSSRSS